MRANAERRADEDVDVRLRVRHLEALIALLRQSAQNTGVNRRWIFTPDRRAIETPLVDGLERVGDRSCGA
jgi:hypothetical protein